MKIKHVLPALFLLASFSNRNITVQVDEDVNGNYTRVVVTNNTANSVFIQVSRVNNPAVKYSSTFGPGANEIAISTGVATRIQRALNSTGKRDGISWVMNYPGGS